MRFWSIAAVVCGVLVLVGLAGWLGTRSGSHSKPHRTAARQTDTPLGATAAPTASTFTAAEQKAAVDTQNAWRVKYGITVPLTWDAKMGALAQDWANTLAADGTFRHRESNFGENIAAGHPTIEAAVQAWGSEDADYTRATNSCADGKQCGHFTQIIWSTTTKVGCGKATYTKGDFQGSIVWVCNYDPAGNVDGYTPWQGYTPGQ